MGLFRCCSSLRVKLFQWNATYREVTCATTCHLIVTGSGSAPSTMSKCGTRFTCTYQAAVSSRTGPCHPVDLGLVRKAHGDSCAGAELQGPVLTLSHARGCLQKASMTCSGRTVPCV